MREALLSIGKMAALNRMSVSTLRLYDEKGLLKPCYTDPRTGYRYYDINQNARLDMIVYMKELGMSLAEIAQVLQKEDISLIEEILSRKNEQLHQQIRELMRWSGRFFPLSVTGNHRLPEHSPLNTLTAGIPGESHARRTFTRTTFIAMSACCAGCG